MKLSHQKLAEKLSAGEPAPVYLVTGEQDLLRELSLSRIQTAVVGDEPNGFNLERFDAEDGSIESVFVSANMMPLMGGKRCVVVRRGLRMVQPPRSKSDDVKKGSPIEAFLAYVENPSPHTVLAVELEKKPDGRRKAWKQFEKLATVVQCDPPKEAELVAFIQDQAKVRQLKLDRDAVRYLIGLFGADLRRLTNELEKLSLYAGSERLSLETLGELLGRGKAQSIFRFTDAVADRDARSAVELLDRLIGEGEPPLRILALLDRLVGQLRVAREIQSSGSRGTSLAQALGVPPFVAQKLSSQAKAFAPARLRRAHRALASADRWMKSSSVPQRLPLESLVLTLCGNDDSARVPSSVYRGR